MHAMIRETFEALGKLERGTVHGVAEMKSPSVPGAKDAEVSIKTIIGSLIMPKILLSYVDGLCDSMREGRPLGNGN
jgi:hypothetical protein